MAKKVPFYSNTPDDTHCFQAALKMGIEYFLPETILSFEAMDKFTNKKEGLWTWPLRGVINLAQMGFQVVDVDFFSLESFIEDPNEYLIKRYGQEVGEAQIKHSDLDAVVKDCEEYLKLGLHQERIPDQTEIKKLIDEGYLVICNVNSQALHNKNGYVGHFVAIFDYDTDNFILHDPGLPPIENLKVSFNQFKKGWEYPDERSANLLAIKRI